MKQTPEKADVVKVNSKNVELVEKDKFNSTSSKGSVVKDFAFVVGTEIAKTVGPAFAEGVMKEFEDNRAERKAFRQDMRAELQEEHKHYMELISKEEAKEDYDQERLDRWYARLDKIRQDRRDIEEKSNGGLLKFVKDLKDFMSSIKN
ncbi:hypothetical protein [Niallia endozanthoxylica]|uniref:Uncharacterized protein n=1 Tax=Niallia endozanthoxylica TaxID=2036016 RepID=A0A5J5HQ10_9BACI|nr:hypothetical protein [Niallia endozanthoxylica]KAA9023559.1 hypothetical protein F4V44_12900 [Niallia endozanthoxylica]